MQAVRKPGPKPKKTALRKVVSGAFTETEYTFIHEYAQKAGITPGSLCRKALLAYLGSEAGSLELAK